MKVPSALALAIEQVGRKVKAGKLSHDKAVDALEPLLNKGENRVLLREIHRRFLLNQIKAWIAGAVATATEDDERGQPPLPFPYLSHLIEISPGTFKHQNVMNEIKDWDMAVVQAETKHANTGGYLERILRARGEWISSQTKSGEEKQA